MGNNASQNSTKITDKIELINTTKHPLFGKIDIYHVTQPPYEYLMDYKKTYVNDKQRLEKDLSLMNQLKNIEHSNLAKIYQNQLVQDAQLCVKHQMLHTYTNYYNFTLKQAMEKKKMTKHYFSQGDLLYISKSLVGVASELQKFGISKGNYRSQEIFLSPQGHIKLYLLNIDQENKHSCYYTVLSEKQKLSEYLLSPQQLEHMQRLELHTKFDQFKADMFAIGLVMVELITLDNAKFYYNYQTLEFKADKIHFLLDNLAGNRYSEALINIVKSMLEMDPKNRPEFNDLYLKIEDLISQQKDRVIYCIRLEADPNPNPKSLEPPKRKMMLSTLSSKLTPKPISMLSSTSSTVMNASQKQP